MSRKNNKNRFNGNNVEQNKDSKLCKAQKERNNRKRQKGFPSKDIVYGQDGGNDPSYWNKNPLLTRDAANISLFTAAGVHMDNYYPAYSGSPFNTNRTRFPGVMALYMVPTYGISVEEEASVLNVAARNLYSFVRHANSGHSNYDSPDLMCYLLAMDSIRYLYKFACRTYGIMQTVSPMNRYLPNTLYRASGFSQLAQDVSNMPSLRTRLNNLAIKINSLYLPKAIDVFKRHEELFTYVYQDSPEAKAQIYIMRPAGYYRWDETTMPAKLRWIELNSSSMTSLSDVINQIETALSAVLTSEDFQIMSGDILKAFGDARLEVVPGIDETYSVTPIYNAEMLMEFENATILGNAGSSLKNLDITQNPNTGVLIAAPYYESSVAGVMTPQYLNFHKEAVEPLDVLTATRMKVLFENEQYDAADKKWRSVIKHVGTEICTRALIWTINDATGEPAIDVDMGTFSAHATNVAEEKDLHLLASISKFDWAPFIYVLQYSDATSEASYANTDVVGDFDNYALTDGDVIANCHAVALTSAYGIPYTV